MKLDIQYAKEDEKKLAIIKNYLAHLNQEYDYYNTNIIYAVKDSKYNPNIINFQILFKTFEDSAHIAYNWT